MDPTAEGSEDRVSWRRKKKHLLGASVGQLLSCIVSHLIFIADVVENFISTV